jgi:hypothetical protein
MKFTVRLLPLVLFVGCSHVIDETPQAPEQPSSKIPAFIVEKSNQVVIDLVGETFFQEHYKFDDNRSQYYDADSSCIEHPSNCLQFLQKPHYLIVYTLRFFDEEIPRTFAEFVVDSLGNLITEREVYGVPDCKNFPGECSFIDKTSVVSIAENAGLEPGIKPWRVDFHWRGLAPKTFVWSVKNTLSETQSPQYRASGRAVIIDANTGIVIEIVDWLAVS